jgi:hypothetical protein
MGIDFEELKNKARGLVEKHGDKIEQGLDKASDVAKKRFGHDERIDRAVDKAKGYIRDDKPQDGDNQGHRA